MVLYYDLESLLYKSEVDIDDSQKEVLKVIDKVKNSPNVTSIGYRTHPINNPMHERLGMDMPKNMIYVDVSINIDYKDLDVKKAHDILVAKGVCADHTHYYPANAFGFGYKPYIKVHIIPKDVIYNPEKCLR